jgi:uncharacterized protein (TIRG00374 family)
MDKYKYYMNRQTLWTIVRILITIGLLAFLFTRVDVETVTAALRQADPAYIVVALLLYLGAIFTNILKWGLLLRAQGVEAPWSALIRYTFVGLFFNNLLPAAVAGDVMRGYGLARYTKRGADVAVSLVVDRLVGLIALTGTAVVSVLYAQVQQAAGGTDLTSTFWASLLATGLLVAGFIVMVSRHIRATVGRLLEQLAERLPLLQPVVPIYKKLADSVGAYRHQPGIIFLSLGVALFTWIFSNLVNYTLSLSLHPSQQGLEPISLLSIFIFNPLIGVSQILPLSIGGLGLNQNLYDAFYAQLLGYNQPHVVAVSFLMQAVVYFTSLPGGLIWWFDRGKVSQEEKE